MAERPPLLLRARVVLPIRHPPIEDGAVVVIGNRIAAVGRSRTIRSGFRGDTLDLGETILMPGLVNAHCHLDYTDMAGLFSPTRSFCDWIKLITTEKALWTYSDFAESWLNGARMLVRNGTTTVGDIEAVPELLPDVWSATPLRVLSFLEMTGVRSRRSPDAILDEAVERIESLPKGRCAASLSPHAPYSTTPTLIKRCASRSKRRGWPVCTHVAESATEFDMFMHGHGEMFDWLRRNQRDMSDCGDLSPVQHVAKAGALDSRFVAVHVNYLARGDAELLGRKKVNVVHCPRSRDYFNHSEFPYRILTDAGANVCLGTDSLATVRKKPWQKVELNMFDEMRFFAAANPTVATEEIVRMSTINGATALGMRGKIGVLAPKTFADLIALPFDGKYAESYDAVVHHSGPVAASMIDGQWAIESK